MHRRLTARAAREGRSVNALATQILEAAGEADRGDRRAQVRAAAAAAGTLPPKITPAQLAAVNLTPQAFHGEWRLNLGAGEVGGLPGCCSRDPTTLAAATPCNWRGLHDASCVLPGLGSRSPILIGRARHLVIVFPTIRRIFLLK
ncbi:MAG: hypothetical protein ACRDL5_14265 [Solirubrobacteraceae bacterium]